MKFPFSEQKIENEYHISWFIIAYKFLFGLVELLLGLGITFFGKRVLDWYYVYASQELFEDPHDLIIRMTRSFVPNVLAHHTFLVIYLILLGSAKIAGAIGLIYKQNWGVDLLVGLTMLMFPFQFIRLLIHPSWSDFLYIFIGLFIAMYLINFKPQEWAHKMAKKVSPLMPSAKLEKTK